MANQILIFIMGGIAGLIIALAVYAIFKVKKSGNGVFKKPAESPLPTQTIIEKQAEEYQKNKQKILSFLATQNAQAQITNDDIQNLIGFSDASAERYLNELEKEGALKQIGKTGVKVYYTKL